MVSKRFGFCDTGDCDRCPVVIDVERQEKQVGAYRHHFECGCDCHQGGES